MVSLNELGSMALVLVIAAIALGVGATFQDQLLQDVQCGSPDTWGTFITAENETHAGGGDTANPYDSTWTGCCQTTNETNASQCTTWRTNNVALNTTYSGLESNETLGNWLPIIAVVVAAVVIIGLLVMYLGGLGSKM